MALNLKHVKLTTKPVGGISGGNPTEKLRKKFISGVQKQIESLNNPQSSSRKWWLEKDGRFLADIRYGNTSLLPDGKVADFDSKDQAAEFFNSAIEQCRMGELDKELKEVADRIGRRLKGRGEQPQGDFTASSQPATASKPKTGRKAA